MCNKIILITAQAYNEGDINIHYSAIEMINKKIGYSLNTVEMKIFSIVVYKINIKSSLRGGTTRD
jgi:hypothetical protein